MTDSPAPLDPDEATALLGRLTLEDKVLVLTGGSAWATAALPAIGLRAMVLSDGPSGVRGARWDERDPSLCLPSATALSASWDVGLARRYAAVAAVEARRKGVDVVLGPTVNLQRSPLGGRGFEAFSEDPVLTADLAAAYVAGMQERGVAATLKHYVANDFETDRYTADVRVDDRTLRELYLLAFERGVREARAWCVMSAYNSVNGVTATENPLLTEPLTGEWGFDGVVVGDWTAVRSIASAREPQDLAMPGPGGPWGPALVAAVRDGHVPEAAVDRKVRRILTLAARVGALAGHGPRDVGSAEDGTAFARTAAAEGIVLVRNSGLLPLDVDRLTSVAVIGEHAADARIQGGGSATVLPGHVVQPLAGIRRAVPADVRVEHTRGARVQQGFVPLDPGRMVDPATGGPGARLTHLDADGAVLTTEDRLAAVILDFAPDEADRHRASLLFETRYTPAETGELRIGFASPGTGRVLVDGVEVLDARIDDAGDQVQSFFFPPYAVAPTPVVAGRAVDLRFEFTPGGIVDGVEGSITVTFGTEAPARTDEEDRALIDAAVAAARDADVAVVVVGTTPQLESEGYDRTDLRLPGLQDELVSAVAAANPRTVVVVNSGGPVETPWRDDVGAVLLSWFGGQEIGDALADVLTGRVEPGGRLPTTWPARLEDAPVVDVTGSGGVVDYREGIEIGYRAWLRSGRVPAFPFGSGLGYTTWTLGEPTVSGPADGSITVRVDVTNTGRRSGKQVVQVYARRGSTAVHRPVRWLAGLAVVRAEPGTTTEVRIEIPERALAHWAGGWVTEPGTYELVVGTSVDDLSAPVPLTIEG